MTLLVQNVSLVNDEARSDVIIKNNQISEILPAKTSDLTQFDEVIAGKNLVIIPNLIDLNNASNFPHDSFFATLCPDCINLEKCECKNQDNFIKKSNFKYHLLEALKSNSQQIANLSTLSKKYPGFPLLFNSSLRGNALKIMLDYAKMLDLGLFCTPFDSEFLALAGPNTLGLSSAPNLAFSLETSRFCQVLRDYKLRGLLLTSFSDFGDVSYFRSPGLFVASSIHHLILDASAIDGFDTRAKIFPPLFSKSNKDALIFALQNGQIDVLVSLHRENLQKDLVFESADFGINCQEYFFSLCYTHLVKKGLITFAHLLDLCVYNPAKFLKLEVNTPGLNSSNFMVADLDLDFEVTDAKSPYYKQKLFGKVLKTIRKTYV